MSALQSQTQATSDRGYAYVTAALRGLVMFGKLPKKALRSMRGWLAVRELAELNEHMLADIGLSKADLLAARATPLYEDPTRYLSDMSRARRCRRYGDKDPERYISGLGSVK